MADIIIPSYLKETQDDIHARILIEAPAEISKVEGDLFWDATRPTAAELARTKNIAMLNVLRSRFTQTAIDNDLDLVGEEDGLSRKPATYSIQLIEFTGVVGTTIPKGRILATVGTTENESIEFATQQQVIISSTGTITVEAQCTTLGAIGNVDIGNITVLSQSINGVQKVTNTTIVKKGVDIESDDDYRCRILLNARTPATSGNKYHYMNWALAVSGVGAVKVFPLWDINNGLNGNGSVKVVIADTDRHAVTSQLITDTFTYIETVRPIGATVTVVSAIEKSINITTNIILAIGFTLAQIETEFIELATEYLRSVAFSASYISINKLGNLLFDVNGVIDYSDFKINGISTNIPLLDEEIAVIGTVTLGVVV